MKIIHCLGMLLLIGGCTAQPHTTPLSSNGNDNTLLWEISGKRLTSPSYLFGTFHLLCAQDMPFGTQLKKALQQASQVYMELDMDDPATMAGGIKLMMMKGRKTLKDLYTTAEYKRIEDYFNDSLGTPLAFLQTMKPMLLEALLYPKMMPCKTVSGVEEELVKMAKENKKEILGLETMEFQASIFDSIPYPAQAKELLKTIDSLPEYTREFDTMMAAYKSQDLAAIENQFTKSEFGMDDNEDLLLNDRNKKWVKQLDSILKKNSVFVAVGAGHLVGDKGLINLLRKNGYTLRPILNKPTATP